MNQYRSGFASMIIPFITFCKASGSWNEACYGLNLKLFDNFCADNYPTYDHITQEMIDLWCAKRDTETNASFNTRTRVVKAFIDYLLNRSLTDVSPPSTLKPEKHKYIPHSFEDNELRRFFNECDSIQPRRGMKESLIRKLTLPVFFRLLYSSGLRTTEARLLRVENVDLAYGMLDICKSKGYDQHYVALHDSMNILMRNYDAAISKLQPNRTYFFQPREGSHYSKGWLRYNFHTLWCNANGTKTKAVPYDIRHHYAIVNINSWLDDSFDLNDKLHYLSKSMGHRSLESTRYYYSITPRLSDTLKDKTEEGFNAIVPEVAYDEE